MKKRFFAALVCLCLLVGLIPNMGTTAFAASGHNIGDTVEFAGHEWYIIGTETEGVKAPSGCYTLFANNNDFGSTSFGDINYQDSTLCQEIGKIADGFSAEAKANIVARETLDGISGDSPAVLSSKLCDPDRGLRRVNVPRRQPSTARSCLLQYSDTFRYYLYPTVSLYHLRRVFATTHPHREHARRSYTL